MKAFFYLDAMIKANLVKSLFLLALVTMIACQTGGEDINWVDQDLLEYGVPITIQMPDSADIKVMDWGVQKDITVIGEDWYNLQVFSSRASTHNKSKLKTELLSAVQQGSYFSEVTLDEEDGFIFEMQIDTLLNYDFRHVKIQGDQEYVFQAGMSGTYTREQVEKLYEISKAAR